MEVEKARALVQNFNNGQREAFAKVDSAVTNGSGGCFFLTGFGGAGKTHVTKVCHHVLSLSLSLSLAHTH